LAIGFKREELKARYDVESLHEDTWHSYTGEKTSALLSACLSKRTSHSRLLLNAGSGIYQIGADKWDEVSLDLFTTPLRKRPNAICANVEALPFSGRVFGAVVCVGEVLAYCDPAKAIREFARVLVPAGLLICDFGNSRGLRYLFKKAFGRTAEIVTEQYNGAPERIWIYDPAYIHSLLVSNGFTVQRKIGTHIWSTLATRAGLSMDHAVFLQKSLDWLPLPANCADLITIVASQNEILR
jgi:SAM-dependent methyltransferase